MLRRISREYRAHPAGLPPPQGRYSMSEPEPGEDLEQGRMTVLEHLQELRRRLRNAGIVLVAAGLTASYFAWDFFEFLTRPVVRALVALGQDPVLVKLTPTEGFW